MATLQVEIDIFSGRPNPVIELTGREARALLDSLGATRRLEKGEPGVPPVPTLGYRGMIVSQVGAASRRVPRSFRLRTARSLATVHRARPPTNHSKRSCCRARRCETPRSAATSRSS